MNELLDISLIRNVLLHEAPRSDTHGAGGDFLGGGLLYYALTYANRSAKCLCIGSGGGFVPRMMRQAQRDLGMGETHLVDANLPKAKWGKPQWLADDSFFRTHFSEIHVHLTTSRIAAATIFSEGGLDYVHVDGDHSEPICREDVMTYAGLLTDTGFMTVHDTAYHLENERCGVHAVIDELRASPEFDVTDFPFLGKGLAIVRVRNPNSI